MTKIVLIAGGTGLIGKRLQEILTANGFTVRVLTRQVSPTNRHNHYVWDVNNAYIDENAFTDVSVIINLTGANIGSQRWSKSRKNEILQSRVKSTELLYSYVTKLNIPLDKFITASATGYYGAVTTDKIFKETDAPATDFLGNVCSLWEKAADKFQNHSIKTLKIRTGVVLDLSEGALPKMLKPIKMGLGAVLGNGKQYLPWIHVEDICRIYLWSVQNADATGVYNAVTPQAITHEQFTKQLATLYRKKIILPSVPKFMLQLLLGEMSVLVTEGSRVSSEKIQQQGFVFEYDTLPHALQDLLR